METLSTIKLVVVGVIAAVLLVGSGYVGWSIRDAIADRATAKIQQADADEADRQATINATTEKYLHDQLDKANLANAGVHLGSVRCVVGVPDLQLSVQADASAPAGSDGVAATANPASGTVRDIGPELTEWAIKLGTEREHLRALQHFNVQQTGALK